ncbi:MAG: hypothetical protein WCT37_04840 [Patescibacteria group bacterium]|jgi:hypothetical protein
MAEIIISIIGAAAGMAILFRQLRLLVLLEDAEAKEFETIYAGRWS